MAFSYTLWPVQTYLATTSNVSSTDLYMGALFAPMPGKTITKVGWQAVTATGSPVVSIRLETVSGGLPTNTLVATGAELTNQSISSNTWYNHTLGTPYAVPTGATTLLAATIRYVSGTSLTANMRSGATGLFGCDTPRPFFYSSGSPVSSTATMPGICLEYSDGTIGRSYPVSTVTNTSFNSGSTIDEYGMVFVPPTNVCVVGIASGERQNTANSTIRYRIYDDSLAVLTTDTECTLTNQFVSGTGTYNPKWIMLQTPLYLIGGRTYYITKAATSSDTNTAYSSTQLFNSVAHRQVVYSFAYQCTRADDTGAFTTNTTKAELIAPIVDYSFMPMRQCNTGGFCH